MNGKVVRIKDSSLLSFLYPDYKMRTELSLSDYNQKIIYLGKPVKDLKLYLKRITPNFISLVGKPDIDVYDNLALLKWAYQHKGKDESRIKQEELEMLSDEEFFDKFKLFWVLGVWPTVQQDEVNLYTLFSNFSGNLKELIITAFQLQEKVPYRILESSLLTFL